MARKKKKKLPEAPQSTDSMPTLFDIVNEAVPTHEPESNRPPPSKSRKKKNAPLTSGNAPKQPTQPPVSAEPLTVTTVTQRIRAAIDSEFASSIDVRGEITNTIKSSNGHIYFTLKDNESVISAVMWKSSVANSDILPADGQDVVCRGSVNIYPPRGTYQLVVRSIRSVGLGDLMRQYEALRRRLDAEGLFDPARRRPLPPYPKTIGVVTSASGAGLQDILKIAWRRDPTLRIVLSPARVQGAGAAEDISEALDAINRIAEIDVIIVGRGGGSIEDLWAFNEEPVVRAITRSRIPVVSAVGHETDVTLADAAADVRAPTPSGAAELVVPLLSDVIDELDHIEETFNDTLRSRLDAYRERLDAWEQSWAMRHPADRLNINRQRFDDLNARFLLSAGRILSTAQRNAQSADERLGRLIQARLKNSALRLDQCGIRLNATPRIAVRNATLKWSSMHDRLNALSPLAVLERGYSLTTDAETGQILRSAADARQGMRLLTKLTDGSIESEVVG